MIAPSGERYWGRFGAAGLLAHDPGRGVLLQHRVSWSHYGGTWGIPGGARHDGESAVAAARREAHEEAGVPDAAIRPQLTSVLDLDIWTYTTLVATVIQPFEPVIADPESVALQWVPLDEVDRRPLHPGFSAGWPLLRELLAVRADVVVDAANVIGSVPDGWWRDRAGAARRLRDRVGALAAAGVEAERMGLAGSRWFPEFVLVVEGAARVIGDEQQGGDQRVSVVRADGSGDDAIVAEAARRVAGGATVTVVTSDRELSRRVTEAGARAVGVRWLLDQLA